MRLVHWLGKQRLQIFLLEASISLCLAFILWLYLHGRTQTAIDHVQIPVQVQLSPSQRDQFVLETPPTPRVMVSFTGQNARLKQLRKKLQQGQIQANVIYHVPEDKTSETTYSTAVSIDTSHIDVPQGIVVEIVEASMLLPIVVHRIVERTIPVELEYTGAVRVTQIKIEPATVLVRGPKSVLDRADRIGTLPYAIAPPADDTDDPVVKDLVTVATELEGKGLKVTPRQVNVKCKVQPRKKWYKIADVPVQFLSPEQFPYRTKFAEEKGSVVTVKLMGPAGEEPPPVFAFIDLTKESLGRGRNLQPVRVQLPKEYQIVEMIPPQLAFYLEDPEPPTDKVLKEAGEK